MWLFTDIKCTQIKTQGKSLHCLIELPNVLKWSCCLVLIVHFLSAPVGIFHSETPVLYKSSAKLIIFHFICAHWNLHRVPEGFHSFKRLLGAIKPHAFSIAWLASLKGIWFYKKFKWSFGQDIIKWTELMKHWRSIIKYEIPNVPQRALAWWMTTQKHWPHLLRTCIHLFYASLSNGASMIPFHISLAYISSSEWLTKVIQTGVNLLEMWFVQ